MMKFVVSQTEAGGRADVYVASKYRDFTRSSLAVLFEKGFVKVNSKVAKPSQKLVDGDKLQVEDKLLFEEPVVDLPMIYEDDDVIVINKPAGLLTHSKGSLNPEPTVASFIKPKLSAELKGNRAGIVHRLDRGTSGVIIVAKNEPTAKFLQKQFSGRKVNKTYVAMVNGVPLPEEGVINVPIGRNPRIPRMFSARQDGRPSQTSYRVISIKGDHSLVELKPKTGRTNQIRIHLDYVNHPIVGDDVYGGSKAKRLMLHAKELKLHLPSGEQMTFSSDLPKEFNLDG